MALAGNNPSAVAHLASFLAAPERAEETLSYHGLQGFLFAVATAPELVPPSKWLPAIWGEEDEGQEGVGQAEMERVLAGIMALYNRINAEVLEGRVGLPADLAVDPDPWANLGPEAPLGQWSAGFSRGMGLIEPMWGECLPWAPEAMFPDFAYWVVRLSMFAGREYGDGLVRALEPDRGSLETWAGPALERFEEHMAGLAEFGRRTAEAMAEFDAEEEAMGAPEPLGPSQPIRREKIGRNEPCPCGSGRKYKKCCLGAGSGVGPGKGSGSPPGLVIG